MQTVPTLYFVNIDLKLEWPINVRRFFTLERCAAKGIPLYLETEKSLLYMSRGRAYLFHIFNNNKGFHWNSMKYSVDNDYLWNTVVYFDLFCFWELKSTIGGIEALKTNHRVYGLTKIITISNKHNKTNVCMIVFASTCHKLYFLFFSCKLLFLLWNGTQYAKPKKAVCITQT